MNFTQNTAYFNTYKGKNKQKQGKNHQKNGKNRKNKAYTGNYSKKSRRIFAYRQYIQEK